MLKRHLMTAYGMTPQDYRARWGLVPDYPMVAPAYARTRQELAKKIGLGRRPRITSPTPKGGKTHRPAEGDGSLNSRGRSRPCSFNAGVGSSP